MATKGGEAARLAKVLEALRETHGAVRPGLHYRDPWELLVATVLSAQCTDAGVNRVTPELFLRFPTPETLALAETTEVEGIIRSIGLYRNKARHLVASARLVVERHSGRVPPEREALEVLPGVGRKTASVVLSQGFGIPAFAVDTHVARVSQRLGFVASQDPVEVEGRMTALLDPSQWRDAHLLLIWHGRRTCTARNPRCAECPVRRLCPWPEKRLPVSP